jgi:lysophospholipase L1-like esterase
MRGDSYDATYGYRILAVGGSTTICSVLDDAKAWPRLVQDIVNDERGAGAVFVGNVGRPGHTTVQHALQVEKLLAQHEKIDAILVLAGVNDLVIQLNIKRGFIKIDLNATPDPATALRRAFSVIPATPKPRWYAYSGLARWLDTRRIQHASRESPVVDAQGDMFLKQREYRKTTTNFVDELPDLTTVLVVYERKLNEIIDLAEARRVRPILLTQPSIWREDLPNDAEDRLWFGGPPLNQPQENGEYYSVRALAEGLAAYNQVMLGVCAARRVECIDLAREVPKEGDIFWDDVHYTDRGSRLIAETVANHLLNEPQRLGEPRLSR